MRTASLLVMVLALALGSGQQACSADNVDANATAALESALARAKALSEAGDEVQALEVLRPLKPVGERQLIILFVARGVAANEVGEFDVASKDLWRAFALLDRQQQPDPELVARTLNGLGYMFHHSGAVPAAHAQYQAALPWYEKAYGKPSAKYAGLLSNIGEAYRDDGQTELGFRYASEALAMIDSLSESKDSAETRARLLNNLGTAQFQQGDKKQALDSFRRSLKIQEADFGKDDPRLASALSNIGVVHLEFGDHAKALPYLERALAMKEQQFGPLSAQLEGVLFDLKVVHEALGNTTEAASIRLRLAKIAAQQVDDN